MPAPNTSDNICFTIASRIANEEGIDPLELDPLQSTLDTDALENLVEGDDAQDLQVEFEHFGSIVTVYGDRQVDVDKG